MCLSLFLFFGWLFGARVYREYVCTSTYIAQAIQPATERKIGVARFFITCFIFNTPRRMDFKKKKKKKRKKKRLAPHHASIYHCGRKYFARKDSDENIKEIIRKREPMENNLIFVVLRDNLAFVRILCSLYSRSGCCKMCRVSIFYLLNKRMFRDLPNSIGLENRQILLRNRRTAQPENTQILLRNRRTAQTQGQPNPRKK